MLLKCSIESGFSEEGQVTSIINQSVKADFKLALRVPEWCKNFKASIDGKMYEWIPGKYLNIERSWNTASTVKVTFGLNVKNLNGGKNYPGYMAVKTGPQILAVEQTLNPQFTDLDKLTLGSPNIVQLIKTLLPKGWVGSQIYSTKAFYDGKPVDLNLVPFADAGQSNGDISIWIKMK